MPSITYDDGWNEPMTVEIGMFRRRSPLTVALSRYPREGVPIKICVLIDQDGNVERWYARWDGSRDTNPYWHFDHLSGEFCLGRPATSGTPAMEGHPPTEAQRRAVARLLYGRGDPFGLGGSVGKPVLEWCQFGSAAELEILGNEGKREYYA